MAGRLKQSAKDSVPSQFRASHAVVIGINDYGNGIHPLVTPVNDATRLAELLAKDHGYEVHLLTEDVNKKNLKAYFTEVLPPLLGEDDRLLLYFAGHGVALDGDDGPEGFLVPQDAIKTERESFLPMRDLDAWLSALPCRHLLAILDCCFAGTFRWAATRSLTTAELEVIHQERFDRFLRAPAWQVLTSAAHNQEALDIIYGNTVGRREDREAEDGRHSPFALALYEALGGEGDLIPKDGGDGVITATELYLYLRERVEVGVKETANHRQTPGLWPLKKHDRGEFIFQTPGHILNLPPAPELTFERNPWRGLNAYEVGDSPLYFGREEAIQTLAEKVAAQPFVAVLGASGTGKSSLVKAGLLPRLTGDSPSNRNDAAEPGWHILEPLRPGAKPLGNLAALLAAELPDYAGQPSLSSIVSAWTERNAGRKLLLVIDQLEELVTLAVDLERNDFLKQLAAAIHDQPESLRVVVTLRTDFEPLLKAKTPLESIWQDSARFVVPPLNQADLRQIIEGPASARVLYFEPPELIDDLITEVIQNPYSLPLLSFTLSEMYIHYLSSGRNNRALTGEDYDALGGMVGSLRNRANDEYDRLPDDEHRATMARVMLRMTSVEGGELARRRVRRSELDYPTEEENQRVKTVLDRLVAARLLVTGKEEGGQGENGDGPGQATVEPAHDALVLTWDRLLRWKKAAESFLPLQRQTAQAASLWAEPTPDNKSGLLWDDDPRLPLLEETLWPTGGRRQGPAGRLRWAKQVLMPDTTPPADTRWLNRTELDFVVAGVKERTRFWRRLVGITFAVMVVLVALAGFATIQAGIAATNEAEAVVQTTRAFDNQVRAEQESTRAFDNQIRAEQESTRAYDNQTAAEAESTRAFQNQEIAEAERTEAEYQARQSRSRELAALSDQRYLDDPNKSIMMAVEAITTTYGIDRTYTSEAFGALQRRLSSPLLATLDTGSDIKFVNSDPSGKFFILATTDGGLQIWDGTSYSPILSDTSHTEAMDLITFNPAGNRMVTQSEDQVTVWNTNGWVLLHTYAVDRSLGEWLIVSADGRYVAEKTRDQIWVYSTDNIDKKLLEQFDLNQGFREPFAFIDGQEKAHIGLNEGGILVVDLISGSREPSGLGNEHLLADYEYRAFLPGDPGNKALLITDEVLYFLTPGNGEISWEYVAGGAPTYVPEARLSPSDDWALYTVVSGSTSGGGSSTHIRNVTNEGFRYAFDHISMDDVIFSTQEEEAIVKLSSGTLELVDLENSNTRQQLGFSVSHHYNIETDRLYSIAPDGVLSIWDVGEGSRIEQTAGFVGEIQDVGDDGAQLLTVAGTSAYVWSLKPGNLLHELTNLPYDTIAEIGAYDPARDYVLFRAYYQITYQNILLYLWKLGDAETMELASPYLVNEFLETSPAQDSFIVTENEFCRIDTYGFCPYTLHRINDDHSLTVTEGEGRSVVVNPDGSWFETNGMTYPSFSPDGRFLLVPSENMELAFVEIADGSELGRLRPKAGDRTYTSMGFPDSTILEVKDALGGLIRFDLARIATMDSWDEARDDLEIGRLTVESDRLCWQIDGVVDSDRCVEGVKDYYEPLTGLDNNWERLVVMHEDNTLCFHTMVDSSDPNCLSDVSAYHLLDTDPLRILLVRNNGLAVRIDESGIDLPVECPGALPGDIASIVTADVAYSIIGQLNLRYVDKSANEQRVECEMVFSSEQDILHSRNSWQRIPNSNRYLLRPLDLKGPYLIQSEDKVIELEGRSGGLFAFHTSGDFLVTGQTNGIINLWDSQTGALLHSFPAHSGSIRNLQVNETSIVSSTNDAIRIWRLSTEIDEMLAAAREISQIHRLQID